MEDFLLKCLGIVWGLGNCLGLLGFGWYFGYDWWGFLVWVLV